jgi:DNA polymerase-3 subunit delta
LGQRCSEALSVELERTFASLPATSHLLLTTQIKPDGRSKFTKLLQKYAHIHEFSPIAPWKTEQLVQGVQQAANQVGVKLTTAGIELLSQAVGNDTRQLFSELEKLRLFSLSREASSGNKPPVLDAEAVAALVTAQTHTCLQLADAIKQGQTAPALGLVNALIRSNEPGLRISATLIKQFRTWLWVRLMLEAGERDERAVAQAAQVSNPKRIYFLQQEVRQLSAAQLQGALPLLLALEVSLKQGRDELATLQVKVIELCQLFH